MSGETLYSSRWEEVTSFVMDFIVFVLRSIVFICESVYLTLLPSRFRKLKVSITSRKQKYCNFIHWNAKEKKRNEIKIIWKNTTISLSPDVRHAIFTFTHFELMPLARLDFFFWSEFIFKEMINFQITFCGHKTIARKM